MMTVIDIGVVKSTRKGRKKRIGRQDLKGSTREENEKGRISTPDRKKPTTSYSTLYSNSNLKSSAKEDGKRKKGCSSSNFSQICAQFEPEKVRPNLTTNKPNYLKVQLKDTTAANQRAGTGTSLAGMK